MLEEFKRIRKKTLEELRVHLETLPAGDYVLELGCGHGHFLTAYAEILKKKDMIYFVGVDKKHDRLVRAKRKSDRAELGISWIRASVEDVLALWPSSRKIREIFVLFPDPWPKTKQNKHRFVNVEFFKKLSIIAAPEARFYFRSDYAPYCREVRELLRDSAEWKINLSAKWPEGLPTTVFEGHHPIYESIVAQKTTNSLK